MNLKILISYLMNQSELLQLFHMFRAGGNQINPGGFNTGVSQYIREFSDISAHFIKCCGEKMPEIVWEYLAGFNSCVSAQLFHLIPNLSSGNSPSASGEKELTGGDFIFLRILLQLAAELSWQQNGADFSLEGDLRPASADRF